jgi:cysteine-rich repeat protein
VNTCGNAVKDSDEQCDLGMSMNTGVYGGCNENCSLGPRCGDSSMQSGNGEQCDNGAANTGGYGKCKSDCKFDARCGDSMVQASGSEQCDNGAANTGGYDKCKSDCKFDQRCGDKVVQANQGEECDDGNTTKDDGCDTCSCSSHLVFCSNQCIDPQTSDTHCGAQPGCGSGATGNDCTKSGLDCQSALCGNPSWQLVEGAAEGAPASINTPQIGIDDSGNLIVIWLAAADGRQEIWGNKYAPSTGWGSPQRIVSSTTSNRDVNLAVSGAGKAIVSWESNYDIYAAYFDGSTWELSGEAGVIDVRDTQGDAPVSGIDGNGAAIVAWDQEGRALGRNMASDGTWAAATEALSNGERGARDLSLSMSRSGRAITAWNEKADNYPRNIEARGYDADWLNDETVSNLDFQADEVKVVMLADTSMSALAVYDEDNVKRWKTYNGTRWTYPAADFDTNNSVNWTTLKLASGQNGSAFALWLSNTGSLEVRRFASSAWSSTTALNATGEIGDSPDIVVDASGKAYVVWEQEFQSDHRISFRSYTTAWQTGTVLPASNYSKDPRIAINKNGKLAVAWDQTGTLGVAYLK